MKYHIFYRATLNGFLFAGVSAAAAAGGFSFNSPASNSFVYET